MTKGVVIVLGMHRSGTSALTRGLTCLGIGLGDDLKPAVAGDNAKGFFEDWELSRINDELLNLQGAQWDSLCIRDGWAADRAKALKLRASLAIEERFGSYQYFAFKDPRTCRTLPFWKDLFARHELQTFYVIAFRNPMSVASSLETRDNFPRIRSYYLWLLHTLNAVLHTKESQRVFVEYDDLLQEPEAALRSIRDLVSDPTIAILPDELEAYKQEFIDQQARHHKHEPFHLALDETCPSLVRETYRQLQLAKTGSFDADQWQVLFNALDNLASFSELPDYLDQRAKQAGDQLNKVTDERNVRETRISNLSQDLIERDALIASNTAAISQRDARISSLSHDLGERDRNIAILTDTIGDRDAKIDHLSKDLIERDAHIGSLSQAMTERTARINSLSQDLIERDAHIDSLSQAMAESTDRVNSLSQDLIERDAHIDSLSQAMTERTAQINSLSQDLIEGNAQIDYLSQAATEREKVIANLRQGMAETREGFAECLRDAEERVALLEMQLTREKASLQHLHRQLYDIHQSLSWRAWSFFSAMNRNIFGQRSRVPSPIAQINQVPSHTKSTTLIARAPTPRREPQDVSVAYFTICSRNFLAFARTLHASLAEQYGQVQFYVALCDAPEAPFDATEHPFQFVYLDDLDLPQWREMSQRYNITEFNTAIKPFVIRHLMNKGAGDYIVYLDPDIIVKSRFAELETAFAAGVPAVLTPHVTGPAENVEVSDVKMLVYGIYNLGFAAFRNTPDVQSIVNWWGRRLINECVIKLEEGLFVDQKWADLFPAFLDGLLVLRHPGYNVAYWNVAQRTVTRTIQGEYLVNGEPLRFAHFSGSNLDDKAIYSRHSSQFNTENIGDLVHLLDEYRDRVFSNGHTMYRSIPYAFSWNGAAGVNLHTPMPAAQIIEPLTLDNAPTSSTSKAASSKLLAAPVETSGGLVQMAMQKAHAAQRGGLETLLQLTTHVLSTQAQLFNVTNKNGISSISIPGKKLLLIDWSTPRPDRDAGSITAYHLLGILVRLGFDVTFIPSDLEFLGSYTDDVRALGVRCLHRDDIGDIDSHLSQNRYDFVVLCRAPIASHYIDIIRKRTPDAKIILNTSDLHYLREMREAELAGDHEKIRAAEAAKAWEIDIIRKCDVTIVMSEVERAILAEELPGSDVRLLPLMFVEPASLVPAYTARKDIIFIGGFPHVPNVDAVLYFAREIWPIVKTHLPSVSWHIVGNAPPPEVIALDGQHGIRVHGYVKDITPLFERVRLSVAPLRYGAGIKGKLGTSLSFGVPAIATSIAAEGMGLQDGKHVRIADTPAEFARAVVELYSSEPAWTEVSKEGQALMWQQYSVVAGQRRVGDLMKSMSPDMPEIAINEVRSQGEYVELKKYLVQDLSKRTLVETSLIPSDMTPFTIEGYCAVCGSATNFHTSFMYALEAEGGKLVPNWREHLTCEACKLPNRIRASLHVFYALLRPPAGSEIYLTEQATPLYAKMQSFRELSVTGSKFLADLCPLGQSIKGTRNEDLTRLTFKDNSFDYVLSFDVLEHVSDDDAAFSEIYRCLKPGGRLLFSAPFSSDRAEKVIRAKLGPAGIEHILAPEYHGNPVDEAGSLCFRYFAWDLIKQLRETGFENPRGLHYWSRDFGYLGPNQFLFVAEKPRKTS